MISFTIRRVVFAAIDWAVANKAAPGCIFGNNFGDLAMRPPH